MYVIVSPAYGRDYKSKAEAEASFREGKDFKCHNLGVGGTYCSIRDFQKGTEVEIRYNRLRNIHLFTI